MCIDKWIIHMHTSIVNNTHLVGGVYNSKQYMLTSFKIVCVVTPAAHPINKYVHVLCIFFLEPPAPALLPTELHCDVPLKYGRPVVIKWTVCLLVLLHTCVIIYKCLHLQYGTEPEEGVVYAGELGVSVDLEPGDITCSDVTADDTSCTVTITRDDDYTVSLTLSNDVGSTTPVQSMFDCEFSNCRYHVHVHASALSLKMLF